MKSYSRILLKLSGEALGGVEGQGIDDDVLLDIASKIQILLQNDIEVAVVVGGGNFWRGRVSKDMNKSNADYMGMLATLMNGIAFSDALSRLNIKNEIMCGFEVPKFAKPVNQKHADELLRNKNVVIFSGGTGSPYFTTDTGAVLRAVEINADAILLAKRIDGVYSSDPHNNPNAKKFDKLSYSEMIELDLKAIDLTAATMSKENNKKIIIFDLENTENILKIVNGEKIGTILY